METNEQIALEKYNKGEQYNVSTFIDEDTIIAGYGKLDYDFEFPLPTSVVKEIYGTTSWKQYFVNLGVHQYLIINMSTGEEAISPYLNEDELIEMRLRNQGFTFKKL